MNRRRFLAASVASPAVLLGQRSFGADTPLKIGFVYSGPISDVGWTHQHELGRQLIVREFGSKITTQFVENVPESSDAERVIRSLIGEGCKVVFTTSFGFMESTIKVAREFPSIVFEHATGYKTAKNVGIYQTRFYEGAFLLGVLAGKTTRTNSLGFVGSYPIPEVLRNINAFTLGARSVNPGVHTKVVWLSTWYNPGKEREAAEALVAQGTDVLYQNTDSPAVVQVAEAKGLHAFGQDSDMRKYGPKAEMSANTVNWGVYYRYKVQQLLSGTWKSEDTKWGMKEGMIEMTPLNPGVPADLAQLFNKKKDDIVAGRFKPFAGPLKDQTGTTWIAAGQTMAEEEIWSMNRYVEGVVGEIPK